MPRPAEIKSAVQLLVEGNDQRNFFEAFTSHLSITNVQIQNFGGVSELRDFLEGFVGATGFRETVQSLGIVRDAETSAGGAFQSVQSALSNASLPVPDSPVELTDTNPAVAVLILPGATIAKGCLRRYCARALRIIRWRSVSMTFSSVSNLCRTCLSRDQLRPVPMLI